MIFLVGCFTVILMVPARLLCLTDVEDVLAIISMFCHGFYFLFFCRGIKLVRKIITRTDRFLTFSYCQVGPMVTMIYRMMMQDLFRFGTVFTIFVMGFSQAFYIIFLSFKGDDDCDPNDDQECYVSLRQFLFTSSMRIVFILEGQPDARFR